MNVNRNQTPAPTSTSGAGIASGDGRSISSNGVVLPTGKEDSRGTGGAGGGEDEDMIVEECESFSDMQKTLLKQVIRSILFHYKVIIKVNSVLYDSISFRAFLLSFLN